jgi:restriction endonuclease S subunit
MMGFVPGECDPAWAMYWLRGLDLRELANPGAVPSVNEGQMRETPAAVPPLSEQVEIVKFLDHQAAEIDKLVIAITGAVERLREFRTALISAVVTGKIDVRGEVA